MTKQNKKSARVTISSFVFGLIKANGLADKNGAAKDGLSKVLPQVKKKFPGSKFKASHFFWYLSQYRRQQRAGLGLDRLHAGAGKAAKKSAPKAKKAAKARPSTQDAE